MSKEWASEQVIDYWYLVTSLFSGRLALHYIIDLWLHLEAVNKLYKLLWALLTYN